MNKYKDFTILIPCYNEEEAIGSVLVQMLSLNPKYIVVVDDGSTDKSPEIIKYLQKFGKIILIQNTKNMGVGYALKLGFKYCLDLDSKYVITVDADNQHSKKDTKRLMDSMLERDLMTISGVRNSINSIPLKKRFANFVARLSFLLLYGINSKDPLCGLRVYRKDILPELLDLENGYDWAVSVNKLIKKHSKESGTLSIDAIYTAYSLSGKGLTYFKGFQMLYRMVMTELVRKVDLLLGKSYTVLESANSTYVFLPQKRFKPISMIDERLFIVS